jgi:CRP-like cAMP-binding protein
VTKSSITEILTFAPGEVILYPGVPGPRDALFRVRRGLVRIQLVDEEGNALTLRFVGEGEFFNEEAFTGAERNYFAEALTPTTVEAVDPRALSTKELEALNLSLVAALQQTYRRIERLVSQRLKNRIAAALLEFAKTPLAKKDEAGQTVVHLTHDELASAVGSVRETVTKVVGELAREGLIKSGYGKITLVNPKKLGRLAAERE